LAKRSTRSLKRCVESGGVSDASLIQPSIASTPVVSK
jgi:hypothetical protein